MEKEVGNFIVEIALIFYQQLIKQLCSSEKMGCDIRPFFVQPLVKIRINGAPEASSRLCFDPIVVNHYSAWGVVIYNNGIEMERNPSTLNGLVFRKN